LQSRGAFPGRVGLAEQIALYSVFHRNPVNRAIHALTMPAILLTGVALLTPLRFGFGGLTLDLGLAIVLLAVFAEARLDWIFALVTAAWTIPLALWSRHLASSMSLLGLLSINGVAQAVGWYLAVKVGHETFEERLLSSEGGQGPVLVSSNIYFDRQYFLLRNLGRKASLLESFQQFAISPFAATFDLLLSLGYRPGLRAEIEHLRGAYMARIARGQDVLSPLELSIGASSPLHVSPSQG
jgi:uncharacterized membrane protein YGL010W